MCVCSMLFTLNHWGFIFVFLIILYYNSFVSGLNIKKGNSKLSNLLWSSLKKFKTLFWAYSPLFLYNFVEVCGFQSSVICWWLPILSLTQFSFLSFKLWLWLLFENILLRTFQYLSVKNWPHYSSFSHLLCACSVSQSCPCMYHPTIGICLVCVYLWFFFFCHVLEHMESSLGRNWTLTPCSGRVES